ncbi:MAG: hypothetical protein HONBIEJF_01862 [Fimbriimonadaceae bacterium]|nr:hypothetical protein [Fimbriimonadaceae bacterium]
MANLKRKIKDSGLGRWLLMPSRLRTAFTNGQPSLGARLSWLFRSRETANFTYETTELGKRHLADFVALVTGIEAPAARGFIDELASDQEFSRFVRERTEAGPWKHSSDPLGRPAKRYLYYAFARALKPRLILEAGMDKGLGTCILNLAARRNVAEGHPCEVVGLDQDLDRVFLAVEPWVPRESLQIGDSPTLITGLGRPIDLFIHDTTNDPDHERQQFAALEGALASDGVVISAWHTEALREFADRTGRMCLMFQDSPQGHWYPGSKLGVVFARRR